jgi:hypothetical protein
MSDSVIVGPAAPGVALVALNRPPANFVDVEYLEEIVVAVESAADQRAIVLASEGKHFCAGAALAGGGAHAGSRGADGRHIYDVAIRLFEQPVPVVPVSDWHWPPTSGSSPPAPDSRRTSRSSDSTTGSACPRRCPEQSEPRKRPSC